VGGIEVLNQAATGGTLHLQPYGGAVVAPGDFYAGTNAGHGIMLGADGAIEMWRSNGQPYIDFKTSSGQDYQVRLQADGANAKLSLTGNFGVYRPSNDTILTIGADNGKYKYIRLTNAGTPRWDFGGDNVADAAGNAGSNFFINSFDNSGVYTRTPFTIRFGAATRGSHTSAGSRPKSGIVTDAGTTPMIVAGRSPSGITLPITSVDAPNCRRQNGSR